MFTEKTGIQRGSSDSGEVDKPDLLLLLDDSGEDLEDDAADIEVITTTVSLGRDD